MDDPASAQYFLAALFANPDLSVGEITNSLLWALCLLAINAFFVAVEYSLVAARRGKMIQEANAGDPRARLVKASQDSLERALSTPQLGITLASLALGWIGALKVSPLVGVGLQALPFYNAFATILPWGSPEELAWRLAIPLTFFLMTYLQIVVGELIPKTLAIVNAEATALGLAPLNHWVNRVLGPFAEVPRMSSRLLLGLFRVPIPDAASLYSTITAEELELMIASTNTSGSLDLEAEERELLQNVFEFGDTVASEVMIPRTTIDGVLASATVKDVFTEVAASGHSRYPVIGDSLDDIKGLIFLKELVTELGEGRLTFESLITPLMRPAIFVHENKLIAELLQEMQTHHCPMMVVVDEFGGTAGLVTIENIVEEIVGSISDIHTADDTEDPDIEIVNEHVFIVQAQLDVDEVNDQLNLNLPLQDDYQTIGGFVIYQMQQIPKVDDKHFFGNLEFQIVKAEGPRLDRIRITRLPVLPEERTHVPELAGGRSDGTSHSQA